MGNANNDGGITHALPLQGSLSRNIYLVITVHCDLIRTTAGCHRMSLSRFTGRLKRRWPKKIDHYSDS